MIILSNLFNLIQIPKNAEFTIHFNGYSYIKDDQEYESGDLIIQTETNQYTFSDVLDCYDQCANINQYIVDQRKKGADCIFVDLDEIAPSLATCELQVTKIW